MKLSIVIPVFNEIKTIKKILDEVRAVPFEKEIIVVDDCSTDGTREFLRQVNDPALNLIYNPRNRGKGFCLQQGFKIVTGDIVIIQDADLEYYPDEYPLLIRKILEGKADVVYGTRFYGEHRVFFFYHYMGNKLLNFIANILYDTMLSDLMTGSKAFRREVVQQLNLQAPGFGVEAEITAQIFRKKFKVYEVPISYNGRGYEEGKKITWVDFFRSVYWLVKCRFLY